MSEAKRLELEDVKTLTPELVAALRIAGINTVERLLTRTFDQLKEKLPKGTQEKKIKEIQFEVWGKMGYWFTSGKKLADIRKNELKFTTGCDALNRLLGGGIFSRSITEFAGAEASGKTEVLETVLVENLGQKPDYTAIWFDTEDTFRASRAMEIAKNRGYDENSILDRLLYISILNTPHFEEAIDHIDENLKTRNVKLIFVDSMTASLRAEYVGREVLWQRQQKLNELLRELLDYARSFNLAIVVTNQVVANPNSFFSHDPVDQATPVGGHIMGHASDPRIHLRLVHGMTLEKRTLRIARLMDSSWLPPGEEHFRLGPKGIEDIPKEEKKTTPTPEPKENE
jgi:DNA repair protein RadA